MSKTFCLRLVASIEITIYLLISFTLSQAGVTSANPQLSHYLIFNKEDMVH